LKVDKLEPLAYSTTQGAQVLNISRPTLYKLMQDPSFPKFKIGARTMIPADALRAWVQAQVEKEVSA
jgi:excisionase family DNA binding protein